MGIGWNPRSEFLREPTLLIPGKKPVGSVKIDWGHDLAERLFFATIIGASGRELVNPEILERGSFPVFQRHDYYQTNNNGRHLKSSVSKSLSDKFTFFVRCIPGFSTTSPGARPIFALNTATTEHKFQYQANIDDYIFYMFVGGVSKTVASANNDSFEGIDITLACRYDGAELTIWKDGIKQGTTGSVTGNMDSILDTTLCANTSSTDNWSGGLRHCYMWDRSLSDAEMADAFKDPYQFLISA